MKIALVADHIFLQAGSERVFQYICEEFPEADAYTCAFNLRTTWDYFESRKLKATWLNYVVRSHRAFQNAFPIATYVMHSLDLTRYDVVFSLSATVAKYVRAPVGAHISYCLVPTRALWNENDYLANGIKKRIFNAVRHQLCRRDYDAAQGVDEFLCISEYSRQLIQRYYDRSAKVIHSPVDTERFRPLEERSGDHYLLVSRLERWKKLDYAIEAFNRSGLPLRVIGTGIDEDRLKKLAHSNITFLGAVEDEVLVTEYCRASAVIFTPELEYGLIPLEACATGTPVICYGRGGVTETMIPWNEETGRAGIATALFFDEQSPEALNTSIRQFEICRSQFNREALRRHANRWSIPEFKRKIREQVEFFYARRHDRSVPVANGAGMSR
jgi:glycosyltransferase involved in cell wall biosynthesis